MKDTITDDDPDGLYLYENGGWVRKGKAYFDEGIHVVYFDNKECFACRLFDLIWFPFVKMEKIKDVKFWVVVCSWFDKKCGDQTAKNLFKNYIIKASPTVLIIKNGVVVEKLRGILKIEELEAHIEKAIKGEKKKEKETVKRYYC